MSVKALRDKLRNLSAVQLPQGWMETKGGEERAHGERVAPQDFIQGWSGVSSGKKVGTDRKVIKTGG